MQGQVTYVALKKWPWNNLTIDLDICREKPTLSGRLEYARRLVQEEGPIHVRNDNLQSESARRDPDRNWALLANGLKL